MNPLEAETELRIYQAFLNVPPSRFPTTPFYLNRWTRVNHDRWFDHLRSEVCAAVDYLEGRRDRPPPRQYTGALLAELRYLKPLLKP